MVKHSDTTHDYENPPVVETVLGVQFDRLAGFRNAHLGAFWRALDQEEWPIVTDAPALPPQFEDFPEVAKGIRFQVTQDPACRLQVRRRDGERMIQVQNDRLHLNWLGKGGDYPRYKSVRDGFESALRQFSTFVDRGSLGKLRPYQWEVTYVNHILRGTVWETPADWKFFKLLTGVPSIEGLVEGEGFDGEWHFVIPKQRGRLHIQWQHAVKERPEGGVQTLIRLTLTARGKVTQNDGDFAAISDGLDLGHKTIVCTFKELMTDAANTYWGLKNVT